MTAKVGISSVSYGIGVQNRYSAFLDDEDGFGVPQAKQVPIASAKPDSKRSNDAASLKQKNSLSLSNGSKGGAAKSAAGRNGVSTGNPKQDAGQQKGQGDQGHKQVRVNDNKRPQQQRQGFTTGSGPRPQNNIKYGNSYQEGHAANKNQTMRSNHYQMNGNQNHQSTASHPQQNNVKEYNEVNQQGKFVRSNQRFPSNRPRQFQNEDRRFNNGNNLHQQQDVQANGSNAGFTSQSIEEEKRRRQQKRALDLKFKDPEKKEARRQQSNNTEQANDKGSTQAEGSQEENNLGLRGQRNRRDMNRNGQASEAGRNFKGERPRVRRPDGETNGERRADGQQNRSGPRDRSQRNRNGFGAGSRGSRGSHGDERNQERQRPIPNFSDRSDFPSLAS